MTLDYIHLSVPILKLKGYTLSKKILLSLVVSFNSKGLRMSNDDLAEILDVRPSYISDLLVELESSGDIEIKNRQSRHRAIYLRPQSKVSDILLTTKTGSKNILLTTPAPSTYDSSRNITKELKKKHSCASRNSICDETFQRFFDVYPKKENRQGALREWKKLKPDTGLIERIIEDVKRRSQTPGWLKNNGQYILSPKNYLTDHRWTDETPQVEDCGCVQTQDTTPEEAERLRIEMLKAG